MLKLFLFITAISFPLCSATVQQEPSLPALNHIFHKTLASFRTTPEIYSNSDTILVVNNSRISIIHEIDTTKEFTIIYQTPSFYSLRSLCHIPLTVYMLLSSPEPQSREIKKMVSLLSKTIAETSAAFRTTNSLLAQSLAILSHQSVSLEDLKLYMREMGYLTDKLTLLAASDTLTAIDKAFRESLDRLPVSRKVWFVALGEHIPEQGNVYLQYLLAATGELQEGGRVMYATHRHSREDCIEVVKNHRVSASLGYALFGDEMRMHFDVMSSPGEDLIREWETKGKLPIVQLKAQENK